MAAGLQVAKFQSRERGVTGRRAGLSTASMSRTRLAGVPPPGSFGWNGGFGTSNINDPANNLVLMLLTQHVFQSPDGDPIHADYQAAAYRAIK